MTLDHDPITTTSLADEIAYRLEAAILDGTYAPGTHLPQDELCQRFGVSRTPVREALRKLQAQHLVVVIPNKGATVHVPGRAELIDVYTVRAELEGYSCQLAAKRMTADALEELDQAQEAIERETARLKAGGIDEADEARFNSEITAANLRFHGVIHEASGNARLRLMIDELQSFFPKDFVWRAASTSDDLHGLYVEEHRGLQAALTAGSATRARRLMTKHILHAQSLLLPYLDEHGFWD